MLLHRNSSIFSSTKRWQRCGGLRGQQPLPTHRVRPPRGQPRSRPGDLEGGPPAPGADELPPELQDLAINEDGFLIDTKTGKVINEMGATRFDVAVRALRGELDPPQWVENSERTPGVILSALYQFPRAYLFQVVGRPLPSSSSSSSGSGTSAGAAPAASPATAVGEAAAGSQPSGKASFVSDVTATIARVAQTEVADAKVEVKERLGGKYVSVAVDVVVRAPEIVSMVYDELAKDPRIIMKF